MMKSRCSIRILPFMLALIFCAVVFADDAINFVGAGEDDAAVGTVAWNDPENITGDDGLEAICPTFGDLSHYLKGTMGSTPFAVPADATIDGISLSISRRSTAGINGAVDSIVRLVKGGVISGNNKASATGWSNVTNVQTYGGETDLWGLALTPADVNAGNFGAVLSAQDLMGGDMAVGYFEIAVHYTVASGPTQAQKQAGFFMATP